VSEKTTQTQIFQALGGRVDVRLFRNNVGTAWMGQTHRTKNGSVVISNPRRVVFGLHKGSGDLIGWREVEITPEMVGRTVAQFVSLEIKAPGGKVGPLQQNWADVINAAGGRAGVVHGVDEAAAVVFGDDPAGVMPAQTTGRKF
jgi:hypothetical protein